MLHLHGADLAAERDFAVEQKDESENHGAPVLTRSDVEAVVRRYGHAWMTQRTDSLSDLFTPDVIYKEKPKRVMRSLAQVEKYWRTQVAKSESQISFTPYPAKTVLDTEKSEAVVVWEASFIAHRGGSKPEAKQFAQSARLRLQYDAEQSLWRIALLEEYLHHFDACLKQSTSKRKKKTKTTTIVQLKDGQSERVRGDWLKEPEHPGPERVNCDASARNGEGSSCSSPNSHSATTNNNKRSRSGGLAAEGEQTSPRGPCGLVPLPKRPRPNRPGELVPLPKLKAERREDLEQSTALHLLSNPFISKHFLSNSKGTQ